MEEVYVEPDVDEEVRSAVSANRLAGVIVLLVIGALAGGIAIGILLSRTPSPT